MTMVAVTHEGETVLPDEVNIEEFAGKCPECGGKLTGKKGHYRNDRWWSRHFWHSARAGNSKGSSNDQITDCSTKSVNESNQHKIMKYVVSRNLLKTFDNHASVSRETQISDTGRIADVVAEFETDIPRLGNGLIVECQYANNTKPKLAVSLDYLRAGYSVAWVHERHFSSDWRSVKIPDSTRPWPQMVPRAENWRGYTAGQEYLSRISPKRPPMRIIFPSEVEDELRSELKEYWKRGKEGFRYNVECRLSENHATRQCQLCMRDADWYLLDYGHLAAFRCSAHHPTRGETNTQEAET